jgi:hypothetical protein
MNLMQWSNRALILLAAACGVGGLLIGTSSSQEAKRPPVETELGRYQISANEERIWMADTKTGQLWEKKYSNSSEGAWRVVPRPWDGKK